MDFPDNLPGCLAASTTAFKEAVGKKTYN